MILAALWHAPGLGPFALGDMACFRLPLTALYSCYSLFSLWNPLDLHFQVTGTPIKDRLTGVLSLPVSVSVTPEEPVLVPSRETSPG